MYEGYADIPVSQLNKIKAKDCFKCYYGSRTTANKKSVSYCVCDYIHITGMMRGCLPGTCRENGVFLERNKKGKRPKNVLRL